MRLSGDRNQCTSCKLYFNSTRAFDRHRYGSYTPNQRGCLSVVQMVEKGMAVNARGFWVSEVNPKWAIGRELALAENE